jgi:hypothetical protein
MALPDSTVALDADITSASSRGRDLAGPALTIDPWQYVLDPEYIFAFIPPPGYRMLQTLPFPTLLRAGGEDRLYLLQRQ